MDILEHLGMKEPDIEGNGVIIGRASVPPRHDRNRDNAGVNCHHTHHLPTPGQGHPPPSAGPSLAKSTRNRLLYLVLSH